MAYFEWYGVWVCHILKCNRKIAALQAAFLAPAEGCKRLGPLGPLFPRFSGRFCWEFFFSGTFFSGRFFGKVTESPAYFILAYSFPSHIFLGAFYLQKITHFIYKRSHIFLIFFSPTLSYCKRLLLLKAPPP